MNILFTHMNKLGTWLIVVLLFTSFTSSAQQTLRSNVFVVANDGTRTLIDGNLTIYADAYCNCVDYDDAWKMTNPGENWGLLRSATTLVVERRKIIPLTDTTYIRMWNMQQRNYAMQVIGRNLNHPNLIGYVKDNFTNTSIPINLNDTSYINFSVTSNSASSAQNRFSIIFESTLQGPVPVLFTGIRLSRKDAVVNVEFGVDNEVSVMDYTLQHSEDGFYFKDIKHIQPANNGSSMNYKEDAGPCADGDNFYRISALNSEGKTSFSPIAKIAGPGAGIGIAVYPNPVVNKQVQVQLAFTTEGKYQVIAISSTGLKYKLGTIQANAVQSSHTINLPALMMPGIYKLQFIGPDNNIITKTISVL
ncbi:MAG: hypothetical protein ABIY51_11355 [Ferruginibacter sp.]